MNPLVSGNFGRIRRTIQDVRGAHVLPLSCIYFVPTVDGLPGANYRPYAAERRWNYFGRK